VSHELNLAGQTFRCRDELPNWQLMKLAKAQQKANAGDVMAGMAGMYDFVVAVVHPDDRARLDATLDDWDWDDTEFDHAIGSLMESYADRPTERSSPSRRGPSPTGQPSRVVSLSPATAKADETSSTDGASAAS
jgi:hypothetical protein